MQNTRRRLGASKRFGYTIQTDIMPVPPVSEEANINLTGIIAQTPDDVNSFLCLFTALTL